MLVEEALHKYGGQPLTQTILMDLLQAYRQPHNKINELEKKELLTSVKRGLYITGPALKMKTPSSYVLANHIYGPSYVSLETALAYWGLIPERVTTISSMTTGSTKTFRTTVGLFRYFKMRVPYYSFGIQMAEASPQESFLIAGAEKAICDMIVMQSGLILRSMMQTLAYLQEDLRIEREELRKLNPDMMGSWIVDAPKKGSLHMLVKTLRTI